MPSKSVLIAQAFSKTGVLSTVVDSAPSLSYGDNNVLALIDSSYVSDRAPAGYADADVLSLIDSDYVSSRAGAGGSSITTYANYAAFPTSGNTLSDQAYDEATDTLYIWNSSQWLDINRQTVFSYYLVNAGDFTGPQEGTQSITPTNNITLTNLAASIDASVGSAIIFDVEKNDSAIQSFTIPSGQTEITANFNSNLTFTNSDNISVDITSGTGKDLVVKINYKET